MKTNRHDLKDKQIDSVTPVDTNESTELSILECGINATFEYMLNR